MHGARRAVHLSRVDLASLDVAKLMWYEYQRLLAEEQPFTFLFRPERLVGVNTRIPDVVMDIRGEWVNVKDWRIPSGH